MFTGLIQTTGRIEKFKGNQLSVKTDTDFFSDSKAGDSICVSGACLTITRNTPDTSEFFMSEETLLKTRFSKNLMNSIVNLEKSLGINDRLDGHVLTGHVDCTGILLGLSNMILRVSFDEKFRKFAILKGSIAIEGISLTISELYENELHAALIPETLKRTNLESLKSGDYVNLEFDQFGKYIIQYIDNINKDNRIEKLLKDGY